MRATQPRTSRRIIKQGAALVALGVVIGMPSSTLHAQRIAPSGVQQREEAPITIYTDSTRTRSHIDGAVRGGAIGLGVGAVTGMVLFGLAYSALADGHNTSDVGELVIPVIAFGAMGGLAGATVGAIIGGIIGR
jgi:hypothetical protein